MKAATTRASYPGDKRPPPLCAGCRKPVPSSAPRGNVESRWYCPDCLYLLHHPEAQRIPKIRAPKLPQEETLF